MADLIQHIIRDLTVTGNHTLLIENSDGFLYRDDVRTALKRQGLMVVKGTQLQQRMVYARRQPHQILAFLSTDTSAYLEDMKAHAVRLRFQLQHYFQVWHVPTLKDQDLAVLELLYEQNVLTQQSKRQTEQQINQLKKTLGQAFYMADFKAEIEALLLEKRVNWKALSTLIAEKMKSTIGTAAEKEVLDCVRAINKKFNYHLSKEGPQIRLSSPVDSPHTVNKVLDYLSFNFKDQKLALLVIDGMAYWQYKMLSERLPGQLQEEMLYAWVPSTTENSRQAIFKGSTPSRDYVQSPQNEAKLWKQYWKKQGLPSNEIHYQHNPSGQPNWQPYSKLGLVYTALDERMHASDDYVDLKSLTENWFNKGVLIAHVQYLLEQGFKVFLTTDHGNVQAKGWRNLNHQEKVGTKTTGSRSQRHLDYSDPHLAKEFLDNNPELGNSLSATDNNLYFSDEMSFSSAESVVTHGGSHLLEVLVPFIIIE